jgi:putative spermidine/putrescine transport system permease protein
MSRARTWLILLAPSVLAVLLVFAVPLAIVVRYSVDRFIPGGLQESAFIGDNYRRFFTDTLYQAALWRTLKIGLVVTLVSLVLSFPLAYSLARAGRFWSRVLTLVVVVPLLTSIVVRSFGWMILLGDGGVVQRLTTAIGIPKLPWMFTSRGVVISLVEVLMPFMVLTLSGVIKQIDIELEQAVRSLGGGGWRVFRDVLLPLSAPGLAAGSLLVFVLSISAYATPALVGGEQTQVLASMIYSQAMTALNWPFASAISVITLLLVLVLVWLQGALLRRSRAVQSSGGERA